MGTRSLTHIIDGVDTVATIYRQSDGYPEGMGLDLAEFLSGFKVVNGFKGSEGNKAANGMGCLAAQIIKHLKEGIGNVYLYPPNAKNCGEKYTYSISYKDGIIITIYGEFSGSPEELITKYKEDK